MPAVNRVKPRPCTVVAYEVNDVKALKEDVITGDLLVIDVDGKLKKAPAGTTEAHGIALKDGYAGQEGFDYGLHGEMDGFSGMTPGAPLFPSAAVAGGLDTTQPAGAVARVRAIRASRIRYNFV